MQQYGTSPGRNTSVAAGAPPREAPNPAQEVITGSPMHQAPGQTVIGLPTQAPQACDPSGCKAVQGFTSTGLMQGKV